MPCLRERELLRLNGNSLITQNGVLYVIVDRGKGGKYQEQKMLPKYEQAVQSFFDGSSDKLFRKADLINGFDYHTQRRAVTVEALEYYQKWAEQEPNFRKELYREIAAQWHTNNRKIRDKPKPFSYFDSPYRLRRENRKLSEKQGCPRS